MIKKQKHWNGVQDYTAAKLLDCEYAQWYILVRGIT